MKAGFIAVILVFFVLVSVPVSAFSASEPMPSRESKGPWTLMVARPTSCGALSLQFFSGWAFLVFGGADKPFAAAYLLEMDETVFAKIWVDFNEDGIVDDSFVGEMLQTVKDFSDKYKNPCRFKKYLF